MPWIIHVFSLTAGSRRITCNGILDNIFYSGRKCDIESKICSTLKPCHNNGACTDVDSSSYRCDCPLGHSGPTCDESENFYCPPTIFFLLLIVTFYVIFFFFLPSTEVALDITANFSGNSYLQLANSLLDNTKTEHSISMTFTTESANGLLYWQGEEPNSDGVVENYIAVSSEEIHA